MAEERMASSKTRFCLPPPPHVMPDPESMDLSSNPSYHPASSETALHIKNFQEPLNGENLSMLTQVLNASNMFLAKQAIGLKDELVLRLDSMVAQIMIEQTKLLAQCGYTQDGQKDLRFATSVVFERPTAPPIVPILPSKKGSDPMPPLSPSPLLREAHDFENGTAKGKFVHDPPFSLPTDIPPPSGTVGKKKTGLTKAMTLDDMSSSKRNFLRVDKQENLTNNSPRSLTSLGSDKRVVECGGKNHLTRQRSSNERRDSNVTDVANGSAVGSVPLGSSFKTSPAREKTCREDGKLESVYKKRHSKTERNSQVTTMNHDVKSLKMENRNLFGESHEQMKDKVRRALVKPQYNVADFYFETGCAQHVAKNSYFETLTLSVIGFNAFWLAFDYEYNSNTGPDTQPHIVFTIAEHFFAVFYTFELTIRFFAFRETRFALRDAWFCFDSILVAVMLIETYLINVVLIIILKDSFEMNSTILRIARLARLTKMARMVRLLKWMQELVVLLKGLGLAAKSVFFTLLLLTIIVYIFSLTFRQLAADYDCETCIGTIYFKNVPSSFATLLLRGTLPDLADFVITVAEDSYLLAILLMAFILLATVTVMNMLTGILVEVVATVSAIESESILVSMVREKLLEMLSLELNEEGEAGSLISKEEFELLLVKPHLAQFLADVGVDVVGLVEFTDFIFKERNLYFHEFVELILQLRGTNTATVRDLVDLRRFICMELSRSETRMTEGLVAESQARDTLYSRKRLDSSDELNGDLMRCRKSNSSDLLVVHRGSDLIHEVGRNSLLSEADEYDDDRYLENPHHR